VSDKIGWEGRDQQLGTRIGTVWNLSQALGPVKRRYLRAGVPKGAYSVGLLGAKTEIPAYTRSGVGEVNMRGLLLSLFISVGVLTSTLQAQPPQKGQAQEKAPAPCFVSGRVVSALDGSPLKSSRIVLVQENTHSHPKVFGATTDSDGHFEIKNITPGRYESIASHTGYVDRKYQAKGNEEGAVLALQPGQEVTDALFRLLRAGVIAGHIIDENGEPMAKVTVSALRKPTAEEKEKEGPRASHKEELITSSAAVTDDRGEYRVFGLEPGDYYVKASESNELMFLNRSSETEWIVQRALGNEYASLYYPGAVAFDQAQAVAVRAGEEIQADFNMRHVASVEVAGKVIAADGRPVSHAYVHLNLAGVEEDTSGDFSTTTDNKGEFSLRNVPPGSYVVAASEYEDEKIWRAHQKIEVGERKIDSLILALGRGNSISGRVIFAGAASPSADRVFLTLMPVGDVGDDDEGGWARVKKDGTFEMLDVSDGSYALHANMREPGWYAKSARYGAEDVLEKGLQLEKGSNGGTLEIVFSSAVAQLDGSVTEHDKPAVAAQVRVRPEPETAYNRERARSASTDQNGHFSISNLAPGKYQVTGKIPADAGVPAATSDPLTVTLNEKEHQSVQLSLEEPKGP